MAHATFEPVLTAHQCRHARELLGWSILDLAETARVRILTIISLEDGKKPSSGAREAKIRRAFEAAGVEFTDDGDARLREPVTAEEAILPGPLVPGTR